MKTYWLAIALAGLAMAGCQTPKHHEACVERRESQCRHEQKQQPCPMAMHGPGFPGVIYYQEASRNLFNARQSGYLSNEQFATMLDKLHTDLRHIMTAEAMSPHHPPMHPMCMKERHGEHHEKCHKHEKEHEHGEKHECEHEHE